MIIHLFGEGSIIYVDKIVGRLGPSSTQQVLDFVNEKEVTLPTNNIFMLISDYIKSNNYKITGVKNCFYPLILVLDITNNCNFNCKHCCKTSSPYGRKFIKLDSLANFNSKFKELIPLVLITGGEPTNHPQFQSIVNSVNSANIKLLTNGSNLDLIPDSILKKINRVQISIYGFDQNSFSSFTHSNQRISSINLVIKNTILSHPEIFFEGSIALNRDLIPYMEDLVIRCIECKFNRITFSTITPIGRASSDYAKSWLLNDQDYGIIVSEMDRLIKKYPNIEIIKWDERKETYSEDYFKDIPMCGAGHYHLCLNSDSEIIACDILPTAIFPSCKLSSDGLKFNKKPESMDVYLNKYLDNIEKIGHDPLDYCSYIASSYKNKERPMM